jgi:hypothetical protein
MSKELNNKELSGFSNENHFTVPDNYFDGFYHKIQSKLPVKKESFFENNFFILKPAFSYVIIFFVIVAIGYSSVRLMNKKNSIVLSSAGKEMFNPDVYNINNNEIADLVCEDNTVKPNSKVRDEDIIYYLVDNNIENSEIIDVY